MTAKKSLLRFISLILVIMALVQVTAFATEVTYWYNDGGYVTGKINNKTFGQFTPKNTWNNVYLGFKLRLYAQGDLPALSKDAEIKFFNKTGLLSWSELNSIPLHTTSPLPQGSYYPSSGYRVVYDKNVPFTLNSGNTYRFRLNVSGSVDNMHGIYGGVLSNN